MSSIAQFEADVLVMPLRALADALAARTALARSLPPDLTGSDTMRFAQLEAQVNAQLEASAAHLAAAS
jgi:hypothetical protein